MGTRQLLIEMLRQLLNDMIDLHQQGAGYYSCIPFAARYNKLLGQARLLFPADNGLIGTFEDLPTQDPKDPADKHKTLQSIRVECNQLITMLNSTEDNGS